MRVALAVPCYIDQLRPQTARATLALLLRLGCDVDLAFDAPCCGQPLLNMGATHDAAAVATRWAAASRPYDAVVMPSGSCVYHVRHHLPRLLGSGDGDHAAASTFELCEFITGPLGLRQVAGSFAHPVAVHLGCHAQRGLRLGGSTERHEPLDGPMRQVLSGLAGLTMVPLDRPDECCGFGGSFAVGEPDVSVAMGRTRLTDANAHHATVLVSSDVSCLLHLEGIAHRATPALRTMHIAELLEEATR